MAPYIICALMCCVFTKIGSMIRNKWIKRFFYTLAAFCPCFLAAVRDSDIGTDVLVYGDSIFNAAQQAPSYWTFLNSRSNEPLYLLVAYLTAQVGNRYVYYFVLQALVCVPILAAVTREETEREAWLGMMIYSLWLFPFTLNIMRQSIAIALTIYGSKFILTKQDGKFLITVLIAEGFHSTAVIGLVPWLIYKLVVYDSSDLLDTGKGGRIRIKTVNFGKGFTRFKQRYSILFKLLLIVVVTATVYYGARLITIVSQLLGKYGYQVSHLNASFNFNKTFFLALFLIAVIIYFMMWVQRKEKTPESQYYILIAICGTILFQLQGISSQLYRVSLYFTCYMMVYVPAAFSHKRRNYLYYLGIAAILFLLIYVWYKTIIKSGWNEIYPYASSFLGI